MKNSRYRLLCLPIACYDFRFSSSDIHIGTIHDYYSYYYFFFFEKRMYKDVIIPADKPRLEIASTDDIGRSYNSMLDKVEGR